MASNDMKSIFSNTAERFFFIGGRTDDEFCTSSLKLCNIEELIHDHLKNLGYERIIFYASAGKGLYFYDSESYNHFFKKTSDTNTKEKNTKKRKSQIVPGPIGVRIKRNSGVIQKQQEEIRRVDALRRKMSEVEMLKNIDRVMNDIAVKSAIVFANWEDFVTYTDRNIMRSLSQKLTEWKRLNSSNENIVLFIIPEMTFETIVEVNKKSELNTLGLFDHKSPNQFNPKRVLWLSVPNIDEIEYLVRYLSFSKDIPIEWEAYEEMLALLSRWIKTKGLILKGLSSKLKNVDLYSKENIERLTGIEDKKRGFERFDDLLGMDKVKLQIEKLMKGIKESVNTDKVSTRSSMDTIERLYGGSTYFSTGANLHFELRGNSGTGKTTLANIIAEVLQDEGLLETGHMVKVTSKDLEGQYVGQTAIKTKEKIDQAMGGVLFIDEAYSLVKKGNDESNNDFGQDAIATLVEAMSDREGAFSVIIAGYPQDIDRFKKSNAGLDSRFANVIEIDDYPPQILKEIFHKHLEKNNMLLDDELETLLSGFMQNWYAARDSKHFGNARDVKNIFNVMMHNAKYDDRNMLMKKDIPEKYQRHAKMLNEDSLGKLLKEIDELIGLNSVKNEIHLIVRAIQADQKRGIETLPKHYVFRGRPGTGKTKIAKLLAKVLHQLKILPRGEYNRVTKKNLVGDHIGHSEKKVAKVLEDSIGRMLFVDEAYALSEGGENDFGKVVINEIVDFIEEKKGAISLVLAGYSKGIDKLLEINEGLKSRINKYIDFEDYSNEELVLIFKQITDENGFKVADDLDMRLLDICDYFKKNKPDEYANARGARKLFEEAKENLDKRVFKYALEGEALYRIEIEDLPSIPPEYIRHSQGDGDVHLERALQKLDGIIGLKKVKEQVHAIVDTIRVNEKRGGGEVIPGHYIFRGNSGTGKTTIARLLGDIFRELKVLEKGHFVEATRSELVAEHIGGTEKKTSRKLNESLGGILFIDEAYALARSDGRDFGQEAIDTIIPFMENHRHDFTLIAAGYPKEMDRFIASNSGMRSRIDNVINFEDYSSEEMLQIYKIFVNENKYILGDSVEDLLLELFDEHKKYSGENFGNGRDARKIYNASIQNMNSRLARIGNELAEGDERLYRIEAEDLPKISE